MLFAKSWGLNSISSNNIKQSLSTLFCTVLLGIVILMGARLALIHSFTASAFSQLSLSEQFNFWLISLRFDLKVISILLAPTILLFLTTFKYNKIFKHIQRFNFYYSFIVICIMLIISIINYYYFKTYDRNIDSFIFALSKEDPIAVLKTIIKDYPIVKGGIALIVGVIALQILFKKSTNLIERLVPCIKNLLSFVLVFISLIVLVAFFARGSFSTFPLREIHTQVCDKPAINYCIPNGLISLQWAYKWHQKAIKIPQVSLQDITKTYKELGINIEPKADNIFAPLKQKTTNNKFLTTNKPNVVLSVMESMSTHLLTYDNQTHRDLLGALRPHIKDDFFFTNFLAEGDGTADSLARLLVSIPDANISTSAHSNKTYITNIVKIFKNAGYKTIFITASATSWRKYDTFLRKLGFDQVIEQSQILDKYPHASTNSWGLDDEFLFAKTYDVLATESQTPVFIMTLSITNHPPYQVPKNEAIQEIQLSASELARFPYNNTPTIFATFRYANDKLGQFITNVKQNPTLAKNTFIVATGDHNIRGIGYSNYPQELVLGHAVPLYIYMPKIYQTQTNVVYNSQKFGSHKDIVTTILSHAVPNFEFYSLGCDLLSNHECLFDFAFNQNIVYQKQKNYVCDLTATGHTYAFTHKKLLEVENQTTDGSCDKEKAFKKLEQQLYFYQALKSKN